MKLQALQLVLAGEKTELRFDLAKAGRLRIGRDKASDFVVLDRTVSRAHAVLGIEAGRLVLRDLGSSNGTFVNEEQIEQRALFPGDRVRFGEAEFVVLLEAAEEGPAAENGSENLGPVPATPRESLWGQETKVLGGKISDLTVVDLVQVLSTSGKSGVLLLYNGRFGRIDFFEGAICFAEVDGVEGEKAFYRLLLWAQAEFEFHAATPYYNRMVTPTDSLLIEGLRQSEDLAELGPGLPPADAVLALSTTVPVPCGLSHAEVEVLQLAVKLKTLARVVEASPLPDVEVYAAVVRLVSAGFLVDTSRSRQSDCDTLEISPERQRALRARAPQAVTP